MFSVGDVVHCDFIPPFKDRDGVVKEVVIRHKKWKYREKYLVEITYKTLGIFKRKKREWFVGTEFLAQKQP